MRLLWGLALAIGCGDDAKDAPADGDTDTDTDTDSDTDADTDTDPPPVPTELTCAAGPCDADPTGSWELLGQCLDDPRFAEIEARCPGIEVTVFGLGVDGTVSFGPTDYVFYAVGGNTGITIVVPPECNEGCLTYQLPDLNVGCNTTGPGGCECTGSVASPAWVDTGTWTRAGGTLTLSSSSSGGMRTIDVCAESDALWLYDPNRDLAASGRPAP